MKYKYASSRQYPPIPPPVDTSCWNLKHIKRIYCNYCEKEIIFNSKDTVERHKLKHENAITGVPTQSVKPTEIIPPDWIQPSNPH